MISQSLKHVLYLGGFLDEDIVRERNLPSHNTAGSNRMIRIACALKAAGYRPIIVSPATSMRARAKNILVHKPEVRRVSGVPIVFSQALGFGRLSIFVSFFFLMYCLICIEKRRKLDAIIVYNFNPTFVFLCFFYRYIRGIRIIQNVEDVSIPKFEDWKSESESRPVQQIVFYVCMHLIARMSTGYIIPTKRFLDYLPRNRPFVIVTGCINVPELLESSLHRVALRKINILFSGKLQFEHGVDVLMDALRLLAQWGAHSSIRVDICGEGEKSDWLRKEIAKLNDFDVIFHGYVTNCNYRKMLESTDICIALQDPSGRYASTKTPSKVYEYLGFGKVVVATNVGDIGLIPGDVIDICNPFGGETLAHQIKVYVDNNAELTRRSYNSWLYAKNNYSYQHVGQTLLELIESS